MALTLPPEEIQLLALNECIDFANKAHEEIGRYRINMMLAPEQIQSKEFCVPTLEWQSIKYGSDAVDQVPDNKCGVYAFVLCEKSSILPPHGYVLYIGIAGRNSKRSLRARYKDYLNTKTVVKTRPRIAYMIGNWHKLLHFYFVPVEDNFSSTELQTLEKQLNTALMPPFSIGDLEAKISKKRRAFQ